MKIPVDDYRRIQNFDFGPARACFVRTKDYCAAVRAERERLLAGKKPVEDIGGAEVAEALNRVYELANDTTLEPARILEAPVFRLRRTSGLHRVESGTHELIPLRSVATKLVGDRECALRPVLLLACWS